MNGKDFLKVARELAQGLSEAHRRSAVGRAYYALFLEAREALRRWGQSVPQRDAHRAVKLVLQTSSDPDLRLIGTNLGRLSEIRSKADYELVDSQGLFAHTTTVQSWIDRSSEAIALLGEIEGDKARRASAIDSLKPR